MTESTQDSPLTVLRRTVPQTGRVQWIGFASERRAPITVATGIELIAELGLDGDHHARPAQPDQPPRPRQVTLIQAEHLPVIAAMLGRDAVDPELMRRNLVVSGIPLLALKDQSFAIGDAMLMGTGPCPPCSRMEENLGLGGYAASRGHGGITARVLVGGTIEIGDDVQFVNIEG